MWSGVVQLRCKARLSRSRSPAELEDGNDAGVEDGNDAGVSPPGCQKRDGSRVRSRLEAVLLFVCCTGLVDSRARQRE